MIPGGADFKGLRVSLAGALALAGAGAAALVASEYYLAEARKHRQSAQVQLTATRERLARVSEEEREIRENLVHFQKMADRRMIGAEKRLSWVEAIAASRQRRGLFDVRYKFEPQQTLSYPGISQGAKGANFMASRVTLDTQLLHEGDLLNFLADLDAAGSSYLSVRDCKIARLDQGGAIPGPLRPRLRATCVVDFITLNPAASP